MSFAESMLVVPRIVHQIWVQGDPEPMGEPYCLMKYVIRRCLMDGWAYRKWRLCADLGNMLFEGLSCGGLVEQGAVALSSREREVIKHCFSISNISDLMRFLILRHFGGLYIDADVELHSFPEGLRGVWVYGVNEAADSIDTSVLAGPPGNHPFFKAVCERLLDPEGGLATRQAPAASAMWYALRASRGVLWRDVRVWPASAWAVSNGTYGYHLARRHVWGSDERLSVACSRNFVSRLNAAAK